MSCLGFLSPEQRVALAGSTRGGAPLSDFASPPVTAGKLRRLRAMAASTSAAIRESAALARHAPPDVLFALADDPVASVRRCVARNGQTVPPLLARLAADEDAHVRGWVAAHTATPPAVVRRLADDPDPAVRAVVAWAAGWARGEA